MTEPKCCCGDSDVYDGYAECPVHELCACGARACAWIDGVGYCHPCSLPKVREFLIGARITWLEPSS